MYIQAIGSIHGAGTCVPERNWGDRQQQQSCVRSSLREAAELFRELLRKLRTLDGLLARLL
jgi:hypothetical protein